MDNYYQNGTPNNAPGYEVAAANGNKKKNTANAAIAVIIIIAFLTGGLSTYFLFLTHEKRLRRTLTEITEKPIIEFSYDDFNNDGTKEAFAVAGNGNEDGFNSAEVWFVSDGAIENLKDNAEGSLNGIVSENNIKYLSVEIKDGDSSHSYIYGVKAKNKSYEPEYSGKYSGVHQDGDRILTADNIEIHFNDYIPGQTATNETVTAENPTENTGKTEAPTEKTEKTKSRTSESATKKSSSRFLEPTSSDFDTLVNKYYHWVCVNFYKDYFSFDSSTCSVKDAIDKMISPMIPSFGLFDNYFGFDNKYSESISAYNSPTRDPKNKVAENLDVFYANPDKYWMGCVKIDAEKVDWLMKNILNVTPDHNYVSNDSYYYDGYYYCATGQGGDGCNVPTVSGKERLSDGKYKMTFNYGNNHSTEIVVALKNIDGKREWSFYNIKEIK